MHHRIHAAYHQAKFSRSRCAWLFINDVPIEEWLNSHLEYPDLDLNGHSLMWLLDEEEDALAQRPGSRYYHSMGRRESPDQFFPGGISRGAGGLLQADESLKG